MEIDEAQALRLLTRSVETLPPSDVVPSLQVREEDPTARCDRPRCAVCVRGGGG